MQMPIILFYAIYPIKNTSMLDAGRRVRKPLQLGIGFVANL
jgi:hypothetical protein